MKSARKQSGQAAIETALVLLVFLPLVIGILDFGQVFYFHQSLTERVRSAARYGAVHPYTDGSDITNVAIYNDPAGATKGATAVLPYLTTEAGVDGSVTATLSGAATDDARIVVTIRNYPYNFLSPYLSTAPSLRTVVASEPYEINR